jgi:ribose transport system permease protein
MNKSALSPLDEPRVSEEMGRVGLTRARLAARLASPEFSIFALAAAAFGLFALLTQGFDSPFNLFSLARSAAVNILIRLAMMSVIVSGGLDLSVGAIGVCASMASGAAMQLLGWPVAPAVIVALLVGAALGFLNGQIIARSGLHSFVVTLGTMSLFFGGMIILTRGQPFDSLPDAFSDPMRWRIGRWLSPMLPLTFVVAAALAYLYRLTDLGRGMLAVGANSQAALLSGISVRRMITLSHALAGLLAALAATLLAMRNGAAITSMAGDLGQDWLLPGFLAPILGGAAQEGGRVAVWGTVFAASLVTIINSGLLLLHVGDFWVQFFLGVLLLSAVLIDHLRKHLLAKRRPSA